ncbi:MAG: hypothetical protein WDN69_30740 [Aliidongia sp.]
MRQLDGELADLDIDKATARARLERLEAAKIEEERIRRNAAIAARIDQLDAHFARLKSAVEEAARINAEGPQIFMAAAGEFGHQAAEAFLPRVNFRGFLFEDLVAIWSKDTEKAIAGSRNALAKAATAASSAGPWSEGPRARADAVNHPVPAIAPAPAPRPKKAPPPASEPPKPPRPLLRIEGPVPEGRVPLRFTKAGIPLDDKGTLTRIGDQVAVLAFKADQLMKNGAAEPVEIKHEPHYWRR